ncbi:GMP synthase (glutamine-hydrolysing) [Thermosporothrix hazakensis]|jgi:GMP synthase (glutamine-hydrolysing)|uniref:GMP synthase [glutamine-hydrolyzing] n=1 Tax=Thermosporothrix hazakensis TaxID=644383 RepID=A0A326TU55_THEHA|nr:glutamine-hydrolyzing GMP synthase [Thermosporothrix hazakensis]PZW19388.1 GMP synthase (glutamine-hydrolysing) [Thermosporothrix hazakensis]GCE48054.1 GMP synthase [Thermosporothrix hazakensis]
MQSLERRQAVIVLDFGSQVSRLITRRVRECHVYSELVPPDTTYAELQKRTDLDIKGFIFSGGPSSVYDKDAPSCDPAIMDSGLPILGICYGMQLLAQHFGGHVAPAQGRREYGPATIEVVPEAAQNPDVYRIFEGIHPSPVQTEHLDTVSQMPRLPVWMSHGDSVDKLPEGFQVLACTESNPVAAIAHPAGMVGLQFHPEVTHTPQGKDIIRNFLYRICGCSESWTSSAVIDEAVESIRKQVGKERVLCALSGGVDSAVAALLVHRAVGDQLTCVFVDTGCMRAGEREQVVETFSNHLHIPLIAVDASERFLNRLDGVVDPEQKRKLIGEEFIRVFEEQATKLAEEQGPIPYLVQGTLYPDVIESTSHDTASTATKIKTHHNVGGLPEKMSFKLVEPLRMLFKDEVREIGQELGLPEEWVWRHPFPGPGLAIRVIGAVDKLKLDILRAADKIVIDEIKRAGVYRDLGQAFAVLTPIQSVGVMGDGRTYAYVVAVRAVTTSDFMTADWARLSPELLARISNRLVNEIAEVNRVVYDITSKPPATIEWE